MTKNAIVEKTEERVTVIDKIRTYLLPYYHKKPDYLVSLEDTVVEYAKNPPDNVYFPPEGFRRPSLYHPLYLNETPKGKSSPNYSEKDDKIQANITDVNPTHDNSVSIQKQLYDIIDAKIVPVGDIIYAQNDNTYEIMMHVQAGSRSRFQRPADNNRATALRQKGRNNSRFKCLNDGMLDKEAGETWAFCHFFPYGYAGSEGDERIGMRWWSRDNNTFQSAYEKRMEELTQNFYWLVRIEKIDTPSESGVSWDYYTYDEEGNRIDAMVGKMKHTVPNSMQSIEANVWSKERIGENWEWTFGVDTVEVAPEDDEIDKLMENYVYYTDKISFESLVNKTMLVSGENEKGKLVQFDSAEPEGCHLLIAGTTGSGKSVEVTFIIMTLKAKGTPLDVQFCGIDPNKVEFAYFKHDPYWFAEPVDDVTKATYLTNFNVCVFEARGNMFKKIGVENLKSYNKWIEENKEEAERLQFGFQPHVYLVTDEFASLMLQARELNEPAFMRIAAEGRKFGVHAFLATQRPSVDVIRGTLKSNFPAKIGLRLNTQNDSGTLADFDPRNIAPHNLKGMGDNILVNQNGEFRSQGGYVPKADVYHIQNSHKFIYFGKNPNFNPELPIDEEENPYWDYSKDKKEDVEGELIRSGKYERSDDGSLVSIEDKPRRPRGARK